MEKNRKTEEKPALAREQLDAQAATWAYDFNNEADDRSLVGVTIRGAAQVRGVGPRSRVTYRFEIRVEAPLLGVYLFARSSERLRDLLPDSEVAGFAREGHQLQLANGLYEAGPQTDPPALVMELAQLAAIEVARALRALERSARITQSQ